MLELLVLFLQLCDLLEMFLDAVVVLIAKMGDSTTVAGKALVGTLIPHMKP
jgi:hypothetical protein